MNIAYVRVSTVKQNEQRQVEGLKVHNIDKWFIEKVSGKNMTDREQLNQMLDFVREGDTIYVHELSRLGRNAKDVLSIVEILQAKSVNLVIDDLKIDIASPVGKLVLSILASVSEMEREFILERQAEGIAIAKANGVYKGRKKKELADFKDFDKQYTAYMSRELNKTEWAKLLNISRPTLDKLIEEYKAS